MKLYTLLFFMLTLSVSDCFAQSDTDIRLMLGPSLSHNIFWSSQPFIDPDKDDFGNLNTYTFTYQGHLDVRLISFSDFHIWLSAHYSGFGTQRRFSFERPNGERERITDRFNVDFLGAQAKFAYEIDEELFVEFGIGPAVYIQNYTELVIHLDGKRIERQTGSIWDEDFSKINGTFELGLNYTKPISKNLELFFNPKVNGNLGITNNASFSFDERYISLTFTFGVGF